MKKRKPLYLAMAASMLATVFVAVDVTAANATTSTITVDASTNLGAVTHNVAGILHGLTLSDPPATTIDPLHIPFWRSNTDFGQFPAALPRAATIGAQAEWILGDQKLGGTWPGDGGDYTAWRAEITDIYNDSVTAGVHPQWDIWNEPNASQFWGRSQSQFFDAWKEGVIKIRSLDANAVVVGPSIAGYNLSYLQSFLTYAKANGVLPDILSWHFTDSLSTGDILASHLPAEVAEINTWMAANSITVQGIENNESGLNYGPYKPANQVQLIANLQRAGVIYAAKACWSDTECFGSNLNGLLTTSGHLPRSIWWARKAYGDLSGHLIALSAGSGSGIDGLASDDGSTIHIMASQVGAGPDTAETLQLNGLGSTASAHIVVYSIPDSDTAALTAPTVLLDTAWPVSSGSMTVPLAPFPVGGAFEIVVQRPSAQGSLAFSPNQGGNSWSYQYSTDGEATFLPMTYDSSRVAWASGISGDPNCTISAGTQQPGSTCDSVRTWTAADTGLLTIGASSTISVAPGCGGSGVDLSIMKNGGFLWPTFGTQYVNNGATYSFPSVTTRVTKGDQLQFVVAHHGANNLCDVTSWDPSLTLAPDEEGTYGFSSSQTTNNWSYQYSTDGDVTFSNMTYSSPNNWWSSGSGPDPYCIVLQDSQHPGTTCDSARTWTAPSSGTATIRANGPVKVQASCGGTGAKAKIMLNGSQIWPGTGWQSLANSSSTAFPTLTVKVAAGDKLRFVLGRLGANNNCARTYWEQAVALSSTDSALLQFSGTQTSTFWSYEYSTDGEATFSPMSYVPGTFGGEWTAGISYDPYCVTIEAGQHPGRTSCDSIRTYTAPIAGTAAIQADSILLQPSCASTGIKIRILKNTTQVWPSSGWQTISNGSTFSFPLTNVSVAAGDHLRFVVQHDGSNNNCDRTAWFPRISL